MNINYSKFVPDILKDKIFKSLYIYIYIYICLIIRFPKSDTSVLPFPFQYIHILKSDL